MRPDGRTDERLLAAAGDDPEAFGAFYRRHQDVVLAYMLRRTRDAELAADLTAEVFAAALVACSRFRPGGHPAIAWLFGIARHVLGYSIRRRQVEDRARRRLGMPVLELSDVALEAIERLEADAAVEAALARLPVEQRAALVLVDLQGHTVDEAAQVLGCAVGTVKSRCARGRARLAVLLGHLAPGPPGNAGAPGPVPGSRRRATEGADHVGR